jgi:hypothetical protein
MAERSAFVTTFRAQLLVAASMALVFGGVAALADLLGRPAQAQIAVRNQGYIPFSDAPIYYRSEVNDPVALLQKELDAGKAQLTFDEKRGYLKSTLDLLNVPAESQTLVFSKTSFQHTKISPEHPRALYYNDDVYVGAVHDGKTLEIISFDPMQGAIFYVLDEIKQDKPIFQRAELDCTQCHIAPGTRGVPGVLLRSVYPAADGALSPRSPIYITDQKSPLKERWGGWYVTGALSEATMANASVEEAPPAAANPGALTMPQLSAFAKPFDASAYAVPTSDQVALLVLGHQTQMHNLITLTNYQTRIALHSLEKDGGAQVSAALLDALPEKQREQIRAPAEQLLRYLLFSNETSLGGLNGQDVIASSAYAQRFAALGVKDSKKRSLRDFDLHDRIFRYPLSYLIYSSHFDALPEPAKGYVYRRLLQVLSGEDQSPEFAHLSAQDREAILSILIETKPGLPAEWRDYARSRRLRLAAAPPVVRRSTP